MRTLARLSACAVALMMTPILSATIPAAVAAPVAASSVAGTWKGPFLGYTFTFEFTQSGKGWTGRYRSDKGNKWVDLQNLQVTDGSVRFNVVSQPPSLYTLKLDAAGTTLKGSVQIGQFPVMPLNLARAA